MGRLRLFGELIEAGGAVEGLGGGPVGGGHQVARVVRTAGDYQTTSTAFLDIDAANLSVTLTTGDSWVMLHLAGTAWSTGGSYSVSFDFAVDGQRQGGVNGVQYLASQYARAIHITWLVHVTEGTHTFRPQWRADEVSHPGNLRAGAVSPLMFAVVELT